MSAENGRLEVTGRAILQDAQTALGNDPIRGLIELITNADDAYRGVKGRILIRREVATRDGFVEALTVFDHARGMSRDEFKAKLMKLGAQNQDFLDGEEVRGNLGRGAKDGIAFGGVLFRSIRDGVYNELLLQAPDITILEESRTAQASDYEAVELSGGQNGLAASLLFTNNTVSRIKPAAAMLERLANEAQLRDINSFHEVVYQETYPRPVLQHLTPRTIEFEELLLDVAGSVPFDTGGEFRLRLWKMKDRGDDSFTQTSSQGILVKGSKATYVNTFLGLQSRSESRWLHGILECPMIDQLLRDFDVLGPSPTNNARLVRRDRAGLDEAHPFMSALIRIVQPRVLAALDMLRQMQGETEREGQELRQRLNDLASALRMEIRELLEDNDVRRDDGQADTFQIIPPLLDVVVGDKFSVSVISPLLGEEGEVAILTDESVLCISSDDHWRPRSNGRHSIRTFRFSAVRLGSYVLTMSLRGMSATTLVRVHESRPQNEVDYTTFRFAKPRYTTLPNRTRYLEVLSPTECIELKISMVPELGTVSQTIDCLPTSDGQGFVGVVRYEAVEEGEIVVTALDAETGSSTSTKVLVRHSDPFGLNDFAFTVENS